MEPYMITITLKSIPESLIEVLREAAVKTHRSLNKEIIHRLERSFMTLPSKPSRNEWDALRVAEQADGWENLDGEWCMDLTVEDEIDALYAARTAGREVPAL